jgi:hypothetical protein
MKSIEERIEDMTLELRQQFFSNHMYGPHILARAELLTETALKAGMRLKEEGNVRGEETIGMDIPKEA